MALIYRPIDTLTSLLQGKMNVAWAASDRRDGDTGETHHDRLQDISQTNPFWTCADKVVFYYVYQLACKDYRVYWQYFLFSHSYCFVSHDWRGMSMIV